MHLRVCAEFIVIVNKKRNQSMNKLKQESKNFNFFNSPLHDARKL